ncbi:MAG: hypothetical protein LBD22_02840 [Spirochaetaceae bacterium]|jgi:uncharacterized membrane protein YcgQ (UPF0703/DUF1980 family)|nr:hypothetical protein [Spirochaetaceae bacterium]
MKSNSEKFNLVIGISIFTITSVFFAVQVLSTKSKLEEFNTVLGKNETITVVQAAQAFLNDNKIGTFDENVKFTNAQYKTSVIEIKEKLFIAQTNDIYLNAKDYLGKTIKLEGVFKKEDFSWQERPFFYVLRYGPGCCGYDGSAGFEVMWEGANTQQTYPNEDDWVEAAGILTAFNDGGIYIALTSLTVLNRRGAEFVRQ